MHMAGRKGFGGEHDITYLAMTDGGIEHSRTPNPLVAGSRRLMQTSANVRIKQSMLLRTAQVILDCNLGASGPERES